jgi:hypothetical protein
LPIFIKSRNAAILLSRENAILILGNLKERTMMSRQQKLIYLPLIGTILLCLLVGMYLVAWKRFSKPAPSARIMRHSVKTPADEALKYWTADKMRHAKAAPLPNVNDLEREKQHPRRPPHPSGPHQA